MPKSATFTRPPSPIRMFAGLMSRCTTPRSCANASAVATDSAISRTSVTDILPRERSSSPSVVPGTHSIAMK